MTDTTERTGRWSPGEHALFLEGLKLHGRLWRKIASMIKTRSIVQIRTHAQNYFLKQQNGSNCIMIIIIVEAIIISTTIL